MEPSLNKLTEIATRLDTTVGDLLGHDIRLEMAKLMVLKEPALCFEYLAGLPSSDTVTTLRQLARAVQTEKPPAEPPIPDAPLYYLSAKAAFDQYRYELVIERLEKALRFSPLLWKPRMLDLLLRCYRWFDDEENCKETEKRLRKVEREIGDWDSFVFKELKSSGPELASWDVLHLAAGVDWRSGFGGMESDGHVCENARAGHSDEPHRGE